MKYKIRFDDVQFAEWPKILLLFIVSIAISYLITAEYYLLLMIVFVVSIMFVIQRNLELFIVLLLIINHDLFNLVEKKVAGGANFSDLLFLIYSFSGITLLLSSNKLNKGNSKYIVISFVAIVLLGSLIPVMSGQSLFLGIKAARGFLCIAFYFVFIGRKIDIEKLFKYIVVIGVILTALNNLQYIYYGQVDIFYFDKGLERLGRLRLLSGGYFTIYAPLVAFGMYLSTKKPSYFIAFAYMVVTVVFQGQVRAIMLGFIVTTFVMLIISKQIYSLRNIFVILGVISLLVGASDTIQTSFWGELYDITIHEIAQRQGNVGIRLDAFYYYMAEIMKSPWIGRGIWNDTFTMANPENIKHVGIYLSDIGIMSVGFHFGLIGIYWLGSVLLKIYKFVIAEVNNLNQTVKYVTVGYLTFGTITAVTINCFVSRDTVIYLALILALIDQTRTVQLHSMQNQTDSFINQ